MATLSDWADQGTALTASTKHNWTIGPIDIPDVTNSNPLFQNKTLESDHAYCIENVDAKAGTVTLQNPWGWSNQGIVISFKDFQECFGQVAVNAINPPMQYNDGVYQDGETEHA